MTDDTVRSSLRRSTGAGLGFAVLSAMTFGMSGTMAKGLLVAGWTPAAAVTARILVGALVLLVPGILALRGRWHLLRDNAAFVIFYGLVVTAVTQFAYFSAVDHLQVGVALLIEYTAPVIVVAWLWMRYGHRPGRLTAIGGLVAAVGLVLVLDLVSGASLDPVGVAWALLAMVGCAVYFVMSGHVGNGLPPVVLAAAGLVVGGLGLVLAGLVGLLDMSWSTDPASYDGVEVAWWIPVLGLGVITCALAYTSGIVGIRALGSRVASFVALLEVVFALGFAWLVLDELPRAIQFLGGAAILAGVVLVKLGERSTVRHENVED
ncbi:MAG: EamA family transporter [Nocardioides sp.]